MNNIAPCRKIVNIERRIDMCDSNLQNSNDIKASLQKSKSTVKQYVSIKQNIFENDKKNIINERIYNALKGYHEITEKDFYPPEDNRLYQSNVYDIENGDNFEEYAKWFNDYYGKEIYDS